MPRQIFPLHSIALAAAVLLAGARASQSETDAGPQDPGLIAAEIATPAGMLKAGRKDFAPWLAFQGHDGRTLWEKTFPHHEGGAFNASTMALGDGGFLAAGSASVQTGPAWAVALDARGAMLWEQSFGEQSFSVARAAKTTAKADNGLIVAGGASSGADSARWAARLDRGGRILWRRNFDGPENWGEASDVRAAPGGGFIVAGQHWRGCMCEGWRGGEPWAVKLTADGHTVWEKTFGPALETAENKGQLIDFRLEAIADAPDGGVLLRGRAEKFSQGAAAVKAGEWELTLDGMGAVKAKIVSQSGDQSKP